MALLPPVLLHGGSRGQRSRAGYSQSMGLRRGGHDLSTHTHSLPVTSPPGSQKTTVGPRLSPGLSKRALWGAGGGDGDLGRGTQSLKQQHPPGR